MAGCVFIVRALAPSRRRRKRADNALSSALPPRSLAHYRPQLDGKCMRVRRLCVSQSLSLSASIPPRRRLDAALFIIPIQVSFGISFGDFQSDVCLWGVCACVNDRGMGRSHHLTSRLITFESGSSLKIDIMKNAHAPLPLPAILQKCMPFVVLRTQFFADGYLRSADCFMRYASYSSGFNKQPLSDHSITINFAEVKKLGSNF
jgi:hypothetical protein